MKNLTLRLLRWRVARYLISGGSAAVTTLTLLFILVHFFHVWYLPATVVSFITGVYVSFMMQKFFTFNDYMKVKIKEQMAVYLGIQIVNLSVNTLLMYVSVDILNIHYVISQVIVGGIVAVYSFFVYKNMIFSPNAFNKKNLL